MPNKIFELKHIFGLKLKELRQQRGITYQELSQESGLSVSYLSEIESGKKYPKGDKIVQLSEALNVSYDDLVSLQVPKKLQPVINLIESKFMKEFPLEEFGLNPQKLIDVVAQDPAKANAFISTIMQVASRYEMKQELFHVAALRSYIELHNNCFEELEEEVEAMHMEFTELAETPFPPEVMEDILLKIGVRTDHEKLSSIKALKDLRSLYHPRERLLHLNKGLTRGQKNFLLGREIAFQWLKLKERPLATPWQEEHTFEELLNNYLASYFSAALLMPRERFIMDVRGIMEASSWDEQAFLSLTKKYDATPEMIMQRLTSVLPTYFGLESLFFLRFLKTNGQIYLTKELHLSTQHNPHANELNEHYCRRWLGIRSIEDLEKRKKQTGTSLAAKAQFSKYHHSENEYFGISIAFPNVSNAKETISVTVGFLKEDSLPTKIRFLDDPKIEHRLVNGTCERCDLLDCKERAAEPSIYQRNKLHSTIRDGIKDMLV